MPEFMVNLLGWYVGIRWWIRLLVALIPIGVSVWFLLNGVMFEWGFAFGGVFLILALIGPSDAEKRGYKF